MKLKRALSAWLSSFLMLGMMVIPAPLNAVETFNPTVLVVSYKQLLNGQIIPHASGSGTLITSKGKVLTNAHVVMDEELNQPLDIFSICVSQDSQQPPICRFTASLERYDEKIDLATLDIKSDGLNGTLPNSLPYLPYNHGKTVGEGDSVTVKGFPASGGVTIHTTQGQISGFEQSNGYNYLKTDADIDAGNSGGTMLDAEGNFVGIPSYVVSYYQTAGRALNIEDAATWIDSNQGIEGISNDEAQVQLHNKLKTTHSARENGSVTLNDYPETYVKAAEGWNFIDANEEGFVLQKNDTAMANFILMNDDQIFTQDVPMQELVDLIKIEWANEVNNSDAEVVIWNEREVIHMWGNNAENDTELHVYVIPHGYTYSTVIYFAPKLDMAEYQADFDSMLNSLDFKATAVEDNPNAITNVNLEPLPFTLQTEQGWKAISQKNSDRIILEFAKDSALLEKMEMIYYDVPRGDDQLSASQSLQLELNQGVYPSFKSDQLIIDGMPAWMYIEDQSMFGETIKNVVVGIMDPEYEFQLTLTTEANQFDSGYQALTNTLKNFESKRHDVNSNWSGFENGEKQGEYFFPEITESGGGLSDIAGHRYEDSINRLVELGVLNGYPDGTFKPENTVNRAETLKFILESLRIMQANNNQEAFVMPANFNAFPDVDSNAWFATYVAEGLEKEIIKGYPDGTFQGGNTVILAEALKMALEAHSETPAIQVWSGETTPWYKKYFDSAYDLYLLPEGLNDPSKELTRGELAYIIDSLIWYWPVE